MQKQEKRCEMRLKRFWRTNIKTATSSEDSGGCESPTRIINTKLDDISPVHHKPTCSLPLLQVWPSQDSPRGEADGQSFIFPPIGDVNDTTIFNNQRRRSSLYCDTLLTAGDSGIDSIQASPSPNSNTILSPINIIVPIPPTTPTKHITKQSQTPSKPQSSSSSSTSSLPPIPPTTTAQSSSSSASSPPPAPLLIHQQRKNSVVRCTSPINGSPTSSLTNKPRRTSCALLHPDHARLLALRRQQQTSPDQLSFDDITEFDGGTTSNLISSASTSTTSSLTSIIGMNPKQQRSSDPWIQQQYERRELQERDRRRSLMVQPRYSIFDALDLEYALLRGAARGSIGPYSFSESLHKLTFTQSLAFPALARGLATKRRRSAQENASRPLNPNESGLNSFTKIITAIILVIVSFLVFLIVYKFVRT